MRSPLRILTAWHRLCTNGHSLSPARFIVLCDILEHPAEVIGVSQRGRRLHFTQTTIRDGLHALASSGLVTLRYVPVSEQRTSPQHRGSPSLSATPTPLAYHLFRLRAQRALRSPPELAQRSMGEERAHAPSPP